MNQKLLGVTKIQKNKSVRQMRAISISFNDLVQKLLLIDKEVNEYNDLVSKGKHLAPDTHKKMKELKMEKLLLKREICYIIEKYEEDPSKWEMKISA